MPSEKSVIVGTLDFLDIFSQTGTQAAVEKTYFAKIATLTNLQQTGPIEFLISSNNSEYIHLSESYLDLVVSIVRLDADGEETEITPEDNYGPINLLFHSLFKRVHVEMNGIPVTAGSGDYMYGTYFNYMLNVGKDVKKATGGAVGYFKDTAGKFNNIEPNQNKGFKKRKELVENQKHYQMRGPLMSDVLMIRKPLISNVELKIKLYKNSEPFLIMAPENIEEAYQDDLGADRVQKYKSAFKVKILSAVYNVCKIEVAPSILISHAKILKENKNAKYNFKRSVIKTFNLEPGVRSFERDNIFLGTYPQIITFGFVKNSAYNGKYSENPYKFENLDLSSFGVFINNQRYPFEERRLDFKNNKILDGFLTLFPCTEAEFTNISTDITLNDWDRGFCMYRCDLSNSRAFFQPIKDVSNAGILRLSFVFDQPIPYNCVLIIQGLFDNSIEISHGRNIITDY